MYSGEISVSVLKPQVEIGVSASKNLSFSLGYKWVSPTQTY